MMPCPFCPPDSNHVQSRETNGWGPQVRCDEHTEWMSVEEWSRRVPIVDPKMLNLARSTIENAIPSILYFRKHMPEIVMATEIMRIAGGLAIKRNESALEAFLSAHSHATKVEGNSLPSARSSEQEN